MIVWDVLASIARLLLVLLLGYKLFRFYALFNIWERLGMSFGGAGCLLTIPVLWQLSPSPFEGWATTIFSYGMLSFFFGRVMRVYWGHKQANEAQVAQGKLR